MTYASILLTSYNRPELLGRAIDSLKAHADEPLEILVADDGSSEGAQEHVFNLVKYGVVSGAIFAGPARHNQGRGLGLERLTHMATGDLFIHVDQDVIAERGYLAEMRRLFALHSDLGLLHGERTEVPGCDWRETLIEQRDGLSTHRFGMGTVMAIRPECYADCGPFETRSPAFAEDHVMQRAVAESPSWVVGVPDRRLIWSDSYGIGPDRSTVVLDDGSTRSIHPGPYLVSQ